MTDSGCYFKHDLGSQYHDVELSIVAKDGNVIVLRLDKQLDVSDSTMDKIEEMHHAMEVICQGINDEWISMNGYTVGE